MSSQLKQESIVSSNEVYLYDVVISANPEDYNLVFELDDFCKQNDLRVGLCQHTSGKSSSSGQPQSAGMKILRSKTYLQIHRGCHTLEQPDLKEELCLAIFFGVSIFLVTSSKNQTDWTSLDFGLKLNCKPFLPRVIDLSVKSTRVEHMECLITQIQNHHQQRQQTIFQNQKDILASTFINTNGTRDLTPRYFWGVYIGNETQVIWKEFFTPFFQHYSAHIDVLGEKDRNWVLGILKRHLVDSSGMVNLNKLVNFCVVENQLLPLWSRLCLLSKDLYALSKIIHVSSSVKNSFLRHFERIGFTERIIQLFIALTNDQCPNIRVSTLLIVANLIPSCYVSFNWYIPEVTSSFADEDYVVRQSACMVASLMPNTGNVFSEKLFSLWRNDTMPEVREAAYIAIKKTGTAVDLKNIDDTLVSQKLLREFSSEEVFNFDII